MFDLEDSTLLRTQAYVGGHWIRADSGATTTVSNPATGAPIVTVPDLRASETRRAIEAAQAALGPWRARGQGPGEPSCAGGSTSSWPIRTTWP